MMDSVPYISEDTVKSLLEWDAAFSAIEAALRGISEKRVDQTPRSFTTPVNTNNILLSMPGYLQDKRFGALACKLVTSFPGNTSLPIPLPTVMANILLFDEKTGQLKAMLAGTEITTHRTAVASAVATKYLHPDTHDKSNNILAILGAGTQGRVHAIAFHYFFGFKEIRIWNRTKERAEKLVSELKGLLKGAEVKAFGEVTDCVAGADVIVTATYAKDPILKRSWLKGGVHINAVGAGVNHHGELDEEIYKTCDIYLDHADSAKVELAGLEKVGIKFKGEIGAVISGSLQLPSPDRITVFQSLGVAVEDCAMARMIYDRYMSQKENKP